MVNQNETTPLPIEGRGFKALDTGDYKPGEFRQLSNVEMLDGRLVGRRDIKTCYHSEGVPPSGPSTFSAWNSLGFIGFLNKWTIVAGRDFQFATNPSGVVPMWNPNVLSVGLTGSAFAQLEGFFKYNYINYWLELKFNSTGISFTLHYTPEIGNDGPSDYKFSDLSNVGPQLTIGVGDKEYRDYKHNNFFIFKDRLWLCNSDGLYFSKDTDPTKFQVVDDGGFFKFPDARVNYALAIKDTIYVLCDDSVYAVTYSTSPNQDATIRKISEVVGGTHGCVFRDEIYFINNEGIFSINNNFAEKIIDNKFDTGDNNYDRQTLTPWREYLIINKTYLKNPLGISPKAPTGVTYNLIKNARFKYLETGSKPYNTSINTGISEIVASSPGSEYLDVRMTSYTNGSIYVRTDTFTSFRIPVTEGLTYTVSHKVQYISGSSSGNPSFSTSISCFNAANTFVSSINSGSTSVPTDGNIHTVSFTFTVPLGITSVYVTCSGLKFPPFNIGDTYRFSERIMTLGSEVVDFFDGESSGTDALYAFLTSPNYNSISSKSNSGISYNNYLVPYFDKDTAKLAGNDLGTNLIYMNMDNGSIHTVDFRDKHISGYYGSELPPYYGYISDVVLNPNISDITLSPSLMFMTTGRYLGMFSKFFYMEPEHSDFPYDESTFDVFSEATETIYRYRPQYLIELYGITPDTTKYSLKKFRNLEIMSKFPVDRFKLGIAYDNLPYGAAIDLSDPIVIGPSRPHYAHRIGLNQKASSANFLFFVDETDITYGDAITDGVSTYDKLEISQMQLLWSPTLKSIGRRSNI